MATRKVKRYNGEEDGSFVEAGSGVAEDKESGMSEKEPGWDTKEAPKAMAKPAPRPAPKPEAKPAAKPAPLKDDQYNPDVKMKAAPKPAPRVGRAGQATATAPGERSTATKENQDAANARRAETRSNMMDSAFSRFLRSSGSQRSRPYQKESGMKSGGTASSRADGIATKGKTRGKIC